MAGRRWAIILIMGLCLGALGREPIMTWAQDVPRMTKEEMKPMLGNPEVIILDVRSGWDWNGSKAKIQGAVREDPNQKAKTWAGKYSPDKTMILYCA